MHLSSFAHTDLQTIPYLLLNVNVTHTSKAVVMHQGVPCLARRPLHACREAKTSFPHTEYVITPKIKKLTPEGFGILSQSLKCMNIVVLYNRISNQMYSYFKER